jgi:hypothetical protein
MLGQNGGLRCSAQNVGMTLTSYTLRLRVIPQSVIGVKMNSEEKISIIGGGDRMEEGTEC